MQSFSLSPGITKFKIALLVTPVRQVEDIVLDMVRERRPRFVPRDVVAEFAKLCKL
jgi:hypothetical protein